MDGRAGQPFVEQKIVQEVGCLLVVHKDDGPGGWHREKQIEETITLLWLLNVNDLKSFSVQFAHSGLCFTNILGHIDMSATGAANSNTDVVVGHVFLGDGTGFFGERGREHHEQMVGVLIGVWKFMSEEHVPRMPLIPYLHHP